ncbi:Lactonase drp35 [Polystyrenella longa]|uniref:Lactonase drp35 n=1 Tax=Polystyrenella longa TaxID=2528007 RepID=A0A518CR54_9PLAN|nr:SMP-30/gluconolactonase/LRE family protein [Polystyrenella longa]QDU81716.1 Lactonase drp35 [Polystyrenella longa]
MSFSVRSFLVLFSLSLGFSSWSFAQAAELPKASDVKTVKLFEVDRYCEGVVFDHSGHGYVSHGDKITKFNINGEHEVWANLGAPNGHKVLADGTHLVCDASMHAVLHLDANGKVLGNASSECNGTPLRGPNDLSLDPEGGFYFTDPGGSDDKKLIGTVHYVDPAGKTHLIDEGLAFPNGIVLTPDRKTLYVGESKKNRILKYDVKNAGEVGKRQVFAKLPTKMGEQIDNQPDGICLDADGNLYVAHFGMKQVQVLNPSGEIVARYAGGNITTSNVAFGGPDWTTIYITGGLGELSGGGGLFKIDLGVKGLVILPPQE